MWFIWDGHTRQGPYSEQEICRRLAMGQWSLSVWVRPEERVIYRPLLWMLPRWCDQENEKTSETAPAINPILNEATMIAPLEQIASEALFSAPAAADMNQIRNEAEELRRREQPAVSLSPSEAEAPEVRKFDNLEKTPAELLADFRKKKQKQDFVDFLPEGSAKAAEKPPAERQNRNDGANVLPSTAAPIPPESMLARQKRDGLKVFEEFKLSASFEPGSNELRKLPLESSPITQSAQDKAQSPKSLNREQEMREQEMREREMREQEMREQDRREQDRREQDRREQDRREQDRREQDGREQENRLREARERAIAKNEVKMEPLPASKSSRDASERQLEFDGETKRLSIRQTRRVRLVNQKPKMVSEGSVNLVDNNSATQIRYRRVNPTAPRRRPKGFSSQIPQVLKYLPKQFRPGGQSFIWVVVAAAVIVTFALVSFTFYVFGRKTPQVATQQVQVQESQPTEDAPKRKKKSQRKEKQRENGATSENNEGQQAFGTSSGSAGESTGLTNQGAPSVAATPPSTPPEKSKASQVELAARQEPKDPVQKQIKKNLPKPEFELLRNADAINRYLTNTAPSKRRFVIVGPLTLVEQPSPQCGPCQGKGRLSDGTIVTLSSVIPDPWSSANLRKRVYVRGIVMKTSNYLITVNSISGSIPR